MNKFWINLKYYFQSPTSRVTGLMFGSMSLMFGSWISRIPDIQDQLALSEAELGFALTGIPIGALFASLSASFITQKIGIHRATIWGTYLIGLGFLLPGWASSNWTLFWALTLAGLADGFLNVVMNGAAASIEVKENRIIMSTSHGMFSVGAMLGSGIGSIFSGLGISPGMHLTIMAGILTIVIFLFQRDFNKLYDIDQGEGGSGFMLPPLKLMGLILIGGCIMTSEGVIADWSGVYLKNDLNSSAFLVGLGFAGFSLTMAIGRILGDHLIPILGRRQIVTVGSILGAVGIGMGLIFPHPWIAIVGYTLTGAGFSCIVPVLFSAVAKIPGVPPSIGIASMATVGIVGFMAGPPIIGFIAEEYGLWTALSGIVGLILVGAGVSMKEPALGA